MVRNSCVTEGCHICGYVDKSVISDGVTIEKGAKVIDSIIFPNAHIGEGAVIEKTIVGEGAKVGRGVVCGVHSGDENPNASNLITDGNVLINGNIEIEDGTVIFKNSMVRTYEKGVIDND